MPGERLDKLLAGSGRYTRSEARAAVAAGRVTVDGAVVTRPEAKFSRACRVEADGQPVETAEFVYYMMNKPAGCISATEDEKYPAVTRLLPRELRERGLFPVGRLDADVTGLLILTDDGRYAHRVTSPRAGIPKRYEARLDGPVTQDDARAMAAGTVLADGTQYRPALLEIDGTEPCRAVVTVTEGKFHEVKNLFAARGRKVLALRRLSIGALALDGDLAEGAFRPMTPERALDALRG